MTRLLLIVFAIFSFTGLAQAECPQEAVQTLYNLKVKIYNGQEKDPKQVFGWATTAMKECADNAIVMGQTAELFHILGYTVKSPQDKFIVWSQAYQAVINNGKAYDNTAPTPLVKKPDGTEVKLYTYGTATMVLKQAIPTLAQLYLGGAYQHGIYLNSYPSTQQCPHPDEDRVKIEIRALRQWAGRFDSNKSVALHRLEGLRIVCPKFAEKDLTYTLAHMNMDRAEYHIKINPKAGLRFAELARQYASQNTDIPKKKNVHTDWSVQDHLKLKGITSDLEQALKREERKSK